MLVDSVAPFHAFYVNEWKQLIDNIYLLFVTKQNMLYCLFTGNASVMMRPFLVIQICH